jgi:hypothetical protein
LDAPDELFAQMVNFVDRATEAINRDESPAAPGVRGGARG